MKYNDDFHDNIESFKIKLTTSECNYVSAPGELALQNRLC